MKLEDIYIELEKSGTEQNKNVYLRIGAKGDLFGVSIDNLTKIKNSINSNTHEKTLPQELWNTRNLDARILACMLCNPNVLSRNEANRWVYMINFHVLADHFAELVAKTRYGMDIMYLWIQSPDEYIKRVGFSILSYFAKNDEDRSDLFFNGFIQKIKNELQTSPNRAKEAMCNCLITIGSRTEVLKERVLEATQAIGNVEIDHGEPTPKTINIKDSVNNIWNRK